MTDLSNEKLVRDLIPQIIQDDGVSPSVRKVSGDELDYFIRQKIVEESVELLESGSEGEIADILEAIDTLLMHRNLGHDRIESLRDEKKRLRGAFAEGYVLDMDSV